MASFKKAFAAARKAGKKEFTWNGKRYHTRTKEEDSKKKASSSAPTKSKRPKARSGGSASSGPSTRAKVTGKGSPKRSSAPSKSKRPTARKSNKTAVTKSTRPKRRPSPASRNGVRNVDKADNQKARRGTGRTSILSGLKKP